MFMLSPFRSQLLVIALIASLLGNQCLCAVHMHAGASGSEAAEHSARPHVHLGSAHKHCHGSGWHSHGPAAAKVASDRVAKKPISAFDSRWDHDADAFYFGSASGADRPAARNDSGFAKERLAVHYSGAHRSCWDVASEQQGWRPPPEIRRSPCALYLLHLSIRC